MNRGYIQVTKQLMTDPFWPGISEELSKVFTESHRKEIGNGVTEIHGYSELFTIVPDEGSSQQYTAIFGMLATLEGKKPNFIQFEIV